MILLVHSCTGREWILEHWERFFDSHNWAADVRFIAGEKKFSDQLLNELQKINDRYIWYTLDDYWITEKINWAYWEYMAVAHNMDALRLQPNVQFNSLPYRFEWDYGLLKQRQDSDYHISCATSIWNRDYFLSCLIPGLDPWQTEKLKLERLGDVYFVPELPFWYVDAVRRGKLTEKGWNLIKK